VASLTAELRELIPRLEVGEEWDLPLHYTDAVRPGPYFEVGGSLAPPTDDPRRAAVAAVMENLFANRPSARADAELHTLRARLVRLLGWPNMYDAVRSIPDFWNGLLRLGQDPLFSDPMPYDIVVELLAFKQEIEERYPVILENPLAEPGAG
jgi:hypothetical protein